MKHTPGPWRVIRSTHSRVGAIKANDREWNVATLFSSDDPKVGRTNDEVNANANLIAAAPEMFDLIAALRDHTPDDCDMSLVNRAAELIAKIQQGASS